MLKSAVHIGLAFWILLISTGLPIYKHFCKDQLKSIALFVSPDSCHELATASCCSDQKSCCSLASSSNEVTLDLLADSDCCDNEFELQKMEDNLTLSFVNDFSILPFDLFVWLLPDFRVPLASWWQPEHLFFNDKPPPLLVKADFSVLFQSFLL